MDATVEVSKLLRESGAVLLRQNKHLVYQLPNGRVFTRSKTPSDNRAALNELSDLRRVLGRERPAPTVPKEDQNEMPVTPCPQPTGAPVVVHEAPSQSLKERIEATILDEECSQENLLAAAQAHERRVQMLKALLPFADDPATEGSLRTLLPAPPAPAPVPVAAKPPAPPQQIVERFQVTRELVFAATQTFQSRFTVNDVMDLMTGGRQIEGHERLRVRQSIAASMVALHERGELLKAEEHSGRSQTVWLRAQLAIVASMNGKG